MMIKYTFFFASRFYTLSDNKLKQFISPPKKHVCQYVLGETRFNWKIQIAIFESKVAV